MLRSIGLIEFTSIAKGIECCDEMIKAASVNLIRASALCPGKYMVLIAGDTGSVKASIEDGIKKGAEYVVNELRIPHVHPQLIPALNGTNEVQLQDAVGVIEFYSIASAIKAADEMVKAAEVQLAELKIGYAIGGKGVVIVTGEVGAIRAAIEAGEKLGKEDGYMVTSTVIPRPAKELMASLI
ncbi:BMC domain-containing protein [Cellulosilyticum sp. I15G10I2]|uniref:BMC domain-containing protein n=1 Tax=Cellulosilyticum sp. I15G10I2 TaxID=1892843 RepID=UPI00085C6155|nr:BMC domain-containing protein [Cellulosilyticum sp. I15G10I2]